MVDRPLPPHPTATILVGPSKRAFKIPHELIASSSPFFRERLEDPFHEGTSSLWLPRESPSMFALFVAWLREPASFPAYFRRKLDRGGGGEVLWGGVHLHLFAADLCLPALMDGSLRALRDAQATGGLVDRGLVTYLYTECEERAAARLRRWVVGEALRGAVRGLDALLTALPAFRRDYEQQREELHEEKEREGRRKWLQRIGDTFRRS